MQILIAFITLVLHIIFYFMIISRTESTENTENTENTESTENTENRKHKL